MGINFKGLAVSAILLFGFSSVLGAAPRLQLSTAAVGPVLVASGATGTKTVEAYNAGDGNLNLTVQSSASWLTGAIGASRPCSNGVGSCLPVNITVSAGSLASGTYSEFILLTDPNAVDSPQQISVTMTVAGLPSSVTMYAAPGTNGNNGSPASQLVYPTAAVSGAVSTQSGGNWLQFTLSGGGSFSFGTAYNIQTTPLSAMAPGTYNGSIVLSGSPNSADNKTVSVGFNVTTSPIIQLPVTPLRLTGFSGTKSTGTIQFTNLGQGSLSVTGASVAVNGGAPSSTFSAAASGSTVTVTADPGSLSPGVYSAVVTITSNAANNALVSVPVSFQVSAANTPQIQQGGVINSATYATEAVAQGGIVAIFGSQLAPAGTALSSPSVPLVTSLAGVQVLVNGVPAPLFYVSPSQINIQIPYETTGGTTATIQVVNGSYSGNIRSVQIANSLPRIMPWPTYIVPGNNGVGYAIAVNYSDGSLVLPSANQIPGFQAHPAKPGDLLVVYCLGMGQTNPAAKTGVAGAGQSAGNALVTFGGGFNGTEFYTPALFAGLSGGVGLYQLNVVVPSGTIPGLVPLQFSLNGVNSNFVYIPVSLNGQ